MEKTVMISQLMNDIKPSAGPSAVGDNFSAMGQKLAALGIACCDWILDRIEHRRDRLELARFSDRELKDIGLVRSDVEQVFGRQRDDA